MENSTREILQVEKTSVVATLLFCDVVDYTKVAENLTVTHLVQKLSTYLQVVVAAVEENKGTVSKFIGDAVLAYWLEEEHPDHAKLACRFASTIRERLSAASCDVSTQIGIHTGRIVLIRLNHANYRSLEPLGDAVNLAGRLDAICSQYKVQAIASEQVITHGGGGEAWNVLDTVKVKGKTAPAVLYALT